MAKGKGQICPSCGNQTFHDKGSYRRCAAAACGFIGWSWQQPVKKVGKGKGQICPNCNNQTMHRIIELRKGIVIRRCAICDFSAVTKA